jgi:hypothetical protein
MKDIPVYIEFQPHILEKRTEESVKFADSVNLNIESVKDD